jgi:septal ring factor EnvC (AmiA/AmiB activator)
VDPLASAATGIELERLELAVQELSERFIAQRDEAVKLRGEIAARDRRVEELETELRRLHQSRREVARRIDELIAQIGKLEGRISAQPEAP